MDGRNTFAILNPIRKMRAGYSILVVDNTPLIVDRLFDMLNEMECVNELISANSYNNAIEEIQKKHPQVVLLDIQLPGKNGIELLGFIRQYHPEIITIMLTNMAGGVYKDLCTSMGVNYFVDKSTEFERVPLIIESNYSTAAV
jgi:CheY-like chemotaxis protein